MDERSKKEAIDAIANCTNCGDEKTLREYVIKHSLENGWTGGVLQALDAVKDLPSAEPEQRWIPCSERLPEYGETVLWCNDKGSIFTTAITYMNGTSWAVGKRHRRCQVVAWMPLPEPYQGEDQDDKN